MKLKSFFLLLLFFVLTACSPAGNEPTDSDEPTVESTPIVIERIVTETPKLIEGEATVESIGILILESFPVQIHVTVFGYLGDGCTTLGEISTRQEGETFYVKILSQRPAEAICTQQLVTFEESVVLDVDGLLAGTYTVDVNGATASFTLDVDNISILPDTDG